MGDCENDRKLFSIQFAVDGSQYALDAARLIQLLPLPPGSRVHIVGVLTPNRAPDEAMIRNSMENVSRILAKRGIETTSSMMLGHTARALLAFADDHRPDLIIVGAHGLHASLKILLGGVAQEVIEYARWPVLVVRLPIHSIKRVLLAVDGSPYSGFSAEYLGQFPLSDDAQVHIMHVMPPLPDMERLVSMMGYSDHPKSAFRPPQEMTHNFSQQQEEDRQARVIVGEAAQILKARGIDTREIVVRGDAANEIIEYALSKKIDLIVVGSRGLNAIQGWWWGSVSRKLVHYAPCSVLVVRDRPETDE